MSQTELGHMLGLTQGQVSRIERATQPAHDLDKLVRWSTILAIPQRYLWFQLSDQPSDVNGLATSWPGTSAEAGLDAVGTTLLGGEPDNDAWRSPSKQFPDPAVEVREMTQSLRRLDNRYGGGHSRSVATSYLSSIVEPLLRDSRSVGPARKDLFSAAAEMHQLAGWMTYDVGQADAGRKHLRQALRLCQEVGSDALMGEMLAGMSHHAAFNGSPGSAVDLAIAARHAAKRSGIPALIAEGEVMEAHGLALQGDKPGCLRALRSAERSFTMASPTDAPSWLAYFDHAYLAAKFAHAFRDLGMPREAELFARRSLEMSDGYERGRLFNTALLASTLASQGRVDEACAWGSSAVRMSSAVRSMRGANYVADVGRRLQPFRASAVVRALYHDMAEAGLATPPT